MADEKKIKEPYTPENTPNPPQIIDPNERQGEVGGNNSIEAKKQSPAGSQKKKNDAKPAAPEQTSDVKKESAQK